MSLKMESMSVNGMCRCCASQGAFKDIKTSYHWMGEEEIYGDMLRECFDVSLTSVEQGGICELCITQLRNASNFKKQVVQTESQFKQHLRSKGFKPVKEEVSVFDDNDSDDNDMDNGDDEDYVPDYEIPIKTESESEEKTSKKRGAKAASTRGKKSKSSDGDAAVKSVLLFGAEEEYEIKSLVSKSTIVDLKDQEELPKQLNNLRKILVLTNATPIRRYTDKGYLCCYCNDHYMDPMDLKMHTIQAHDDATKEALMDGETMYSFLVKLDITALECRLCSETMDNLNELYQHLTDHGEQIYTDIKNYILTFKFEEDILKCVVCQKEFRSFKRVQTHMNSHCRNFECGVCGAGFPNLKSIYAHARYTHTSAREPFSCTHCPLAFKTCQLKRNHENQAHGVTKKLYKCGYCDKRFEFFDQKKVHLSKEHGVRNSLLECKSCERKFSRPSLLSCHVKKVHLLETRFGCTECDVRFYFEYQLNEHMVKHTNAKEFRCEICFKNFARKKSLREHVKIHAGDRRHQCMRCDAAFVQKQSLKVHLKSKHGLVYID